MKFTFKRSERPTGLGRIGHRDTYEIKLQKKQVGMIYNDGKDIRFAVVKNEKYNDGNPNCPWMWVFYGKADSFDAAKQLINHHSEHIQKEYTLFNID